MTEPQALEGFADRVLSEGGRLFRRFPWRETRDPYAILVSEVMLQQTQVARVVPYYEEWLATFPDPHALAAAPLEAVLRAWQGLGYNRRAVALKRAAEKIVAEHGGSVPQEDAALRSLPGVGPSTAAGVLVFAFDQPAPYLETNVRAVYLHELFPEVEGVDDRAIVPLVARAALLVAARGVDARRWNFALLDYGAWLKRAMPNPSRRSAHHGRQSAFEGSTRQKRARLLRAILSEPDRTAEHYAEELAALEMRDGRTAPSDSEVAALCEALAAEGFLVRCGERFSIG